MATTFTREKLESMGRDEVRRLCTSLGLMGYSKCRKDECIDAILDAGYEAAAPSTPAKVVKSSSGAVSAMQYEVTSAVTVPGGEKGKRISSTIQVLCGAASKAFQIVGYSVSQVSEFLREALNIDKMSNAFVDGKEVTGDYILKAGDSRLEFIKPAGSKG